MKIWQIKELSEKTYMSFSDEMKLKMAGLQFAFPIEHHDEVRSWLIENMNNPYRIDPIEELKNKSCKHIWIRFTNEEDAIAFKLRWG